MTQALAHLPALPRTPTAMVRAAVGVLLACGAAGVAIGAVYTVVRAFGTFSAPPAAGAAGMTVPALLGELLRAGLLAGIAVVLACAAGMTVNFARVDIRTRLTSLLKHEVALAHVMLVLAGLVGLGGWAAWRSLASFSGQRTTVLITEVFVGVAMAVLVAGAMWYLDRPLTVGTDAQLPWYVRWLLKAYKRVLLLAQIGVTAVAVGAALAMIFQLPMPYPDGKLYRADGQMYVKEKVDRPGGPNWIKQ